MTVVPGASAVHDVAAVQRFARHIMRGQRLRLVVDGDAPIDVPESVREALAEVLAILSTGRPASVVAQKIELTTGEAAQMLDISRPTVVKLMEDGLLPYTRPNSSHRVSLPDVLIYKEQSARARREALDELTADAVEMGRYDEAIQRGRHMRNSTTDGGLGTASRTSGRPITTPRPEVGRSSGHRHASSLVVDHLAVCPVPIMHVQMSFPCGRASAAPCGVP